MGRPGVKRPSLGRHGQFLFRTYLYLVAGLVLTATILDFSFEFLESKLSLDEDQWLTSSFNLIEHELASVPASERDTLAISLSEKIGVDVRILRIDEFVSASNAPTNIATLVDSAGNTSYLRNAPALDALIRFGPLAEARESVLLNLLPPLFYLSIFIVVGLWLRPLLKDLNLITGAAQRFAADYRDPLSTAGATTQLTGLAKNLDEMSSRLSGLIRSQKELIAALSHEMRTPLARIRFALAVLGDQTDDKLQKQLDALNEDVQEIDQLIATMLNYARLDHPDLRMSWQKVPLDAWLAHSVEKCRLPDKELSVVVDLTDDDIWLDPQLMGLALSNMLVNAGHYAAQKISCTVRQRGEHYLLIVEDDGSGVPDEERETIFKAFTRIDDSRNRDTGGYGLGLAIVARIATLHGGTVEVGDSAVLSGAMFTLSWSKPDR
jgi:signal transduction histidine kinase